MKKFRVIPFTALVLAVGLFSCSSDSNKSGESENSEIETNEAISGSFRIDSSKSNITWEAFKYVGSGHNGDVKVFSSNIMVDNGLLSSGSISADLSTISALDLNGSTTDSNKLVGHLKAPDFFLVDSFPTATFELTSFDSTGITGNLTIKGKTKEVTFPCDLTITENQLTASGEQTINRTEWGLTYNSKGFFENLADNYYIKDELKLGFTIVANKE